MIIVEPTGNTWRVHNNGLTVSNHRKKKRAVSAGRTAARKQGTTLQIRRKNGTIQDTRSY